MSWMPCDRTSNPLFPAPRFVSGHFVPRLTLLAPDRSITVRGLDETRKKWEAHWAAALSEEDLQWLVTTARCNSVRLPIGYWTLGPAFCAHTPFAMLPAQVFVNAWSAVKAIVARCYARGIGVLLDLHGVPGGANHETHSGTSHGKAELWGNQFYLDLATRCLTFMAEETVRSADLNGVVGIQVCNEAIWDAPSIYEWYNEVIERISSIDHTLPVYISDAWDLGRALRFTRAYNRVRRPCTSPVVVDTHRYYTFDAKDTSRSPPELIEQVRATELTAESGADLVGNVFDHEAAVALYVGEYSCALAPQTWARVPTDQKSKLMTEFGNAQSRRWQEKASGAAFWTLKMDWMDGWEWGFKQQVNDGNVVPPSVFELRGQEVGMKIEEAESKRSEMKTSAMKAHCDYWDHAAPGGHFEHWRYADGWHCGWIDAREFFGARFHGLVPGRGEAGEDGREAEGNGREASGHGRLLQTGEGVLGADLIGAVDLWVLKRMREENVVPREECGFGWEWEQGFRAGMKAFLGVVGGY